MRTWAGRHEGRHFNRALMLRHFVLGEKCRPVLQRRDMQHHVEEGDELMFLHGIK